MDLGGDLALALLLEPIVSPFTLPSGIKFRLPDVEDEGVICVDFVSGSGVKGGDGD